MIIWVIFVVWLWRMQTHYFDNNNLLLCKAEATATQLMRQNMPFSCVMLCRWWLDCLLFLLVCCNEVVANLINLRQTNKSRCNNAMNADGCAYYKCCSLIASLPRSISCPSSAASFKHKAQEGRGLWVYVDPYVGIGTIPLRGKITKQGEWAPFITSDRAK